MNKVLNIVFIVIIILLTIACGIMIYYRSYWKTGYSSASQELDEEIKIINESGYSLVSENENTFKLVEKE